MCTQTRHGTLLYIRARTQRGEEGRKRGKQDSQVIRLTRNWHFINKQRHCFIHSYLFFWGIDTSLFAPWKTRPVNGPGKSPPSCMTIRCLQEKLTTKKPNLWSQITNKKNRYIKIYLVGACYSLFFRLRFVLVRDSPSGVRGWRFEAESLLKSNPYTPHPEVRSRVWGIVSAYGGTNGWMRYCVRSARMPLLLLTWCGSPRAASYNLVLA